jgi:flagellar biosynthesis GTPase FlhF/predicted RNA-binding Zn-ribbon protein involved in translation (DUF1610 family)
MSLTAGDASRIIPLNSHSPLHEFHLASGMEDVMIDSPGIQCGHCGETLYGNDGQVAFACPYCGMTNSPVDILRSSPVVRNESPRLESTTTTPSGAPWLIARVLLMGVLVIVGLLLGAVLSLVLSRFKPHISMAGLGLVPAAFAVLFVGSIILGRFLHRRPEGILPASVLPVRKALSRGVAGLACVAGGCLAVCLTAVILEAFSPKEGFVQAYRHRLERQREEARESERLAEVSRREQAAAEVEAARIEQAKKTEQRLIAQKKEDDRKTAEAKAEEARIRKQEAIAKKEADAEAARLEKERVAGERKIWEKADLVLANPNRAVALKVEKLGSQFRIRVLAEADDDVTAGPLQHAWDSSIPVLAQEPLAGRISARYDPGDSLQDGDLQSVIERLRKRHFLPKDSELVSFVEKSTGVTRVGHLLKESAQEWLFCDLIPTLSLKTPSGNADAPLNDLFQQETVPISQIENIQRRLTQKQTKNPADFLDYSVYSVLAKLQANPPSSDGINIPPSVFVHDTIVYRDVVDPYVAELRSERFAFIREKMAATLDQIYLNKVTGRGYEGRGILGMLAASVFNLMSEAREAREDKKLTDSLRQQYDSVIKELQTEHDNLMHMADAGRLLNWEIRRMMVQSGARVVDRSEEAIKSYAREASIAWTRPSSRDAVTDRLVEATHLLIPEITKPVGSGEYQLSVRLINMRTLETEWSDTGDRAFRKTSLSGVYRHKADGFAIRVTEMGRKIHVSLVENPVLQEFKLVGVRHRDNSVEVTSCAMSLKRDRRTPKFLYMPHAQLKLLSDRSIELAVQPAVPGMTYCEKELRKNVFEKDSPGR